MKRRDFVTLGAMGAVSGLAACDRLPTVGGFNASNLAPSVTYQDIDRKSQGVRNKLFNDYQVAKQIAEVSSAYLIIPEVTKGGLFLGGAYGNGTMYQGNNVVGHYSMTAVSAGFQIGIQSFSFALFFTTPQAYAKFQNSLGLEFGVDAEYALPTGGLSIGGGTQTFTEPVYALVFNQAGLMAGASLEGAKYTAF